jgi:hypothetical protein
MTGRTTAVIPAAAFATVVVALAARPLLPHPTTKPTSLVSAATPSVPTSVPPLATTAATKALACPRGRTPMSDTACGTLHVSRRQASCPSNTRCQVELVGTLHTRAIDLPIALTVTISDAVRGWRAVEVAS